MQYVFKGVMGLSNYLDENGLTRLWSKIKAYVNEYTGLTPEGVIDVAHGGTGKATHTSNAVLTGNGTSAVNNIATTSGALYATATNGVPKFGTLPIAQGGTGRTTAPSMLVNLASTTAASPLIASPRPGVTGTLPIARGGTGATTAANALANLGGLSMDLLWENASPNSTFAGQTISLDLTPYDYIEIETQNYASKNLNNATYKAKVGEYIQFVGMGGGNGFNSSTLFLEGASEVLVRHAKVDSNGIQFADGQSATSGGNWSSGVKGACLPIRIWGVKGGTQ